MNSVSRIRHSLDFESAVVRGITVLVSVGLLSLILWLAGILQKEADEQVELTDASGNPASITVRQADTSIETPGESDGDVAVRKGALAPNFEASTLTGERVRLVDFRGRAVYLNFWATWCGPCRAEMPDIDAVLRAHEADGLVVLAVNNGESFRPAHDFIDEIGVKLTAVGLDPNARCGQTLRRQGNAHEHLYRPGWRHNQSPRRTGYAQTDGAICG